MTTASWRRPKKCRQLDRNPDKSMSDLKGELGVAWTSLTMAAHCDDETKYGVVEDVVADYQKLGESGASILGRKIVDVNTVNGADAGGRLLGAGARLVNKPELVVVVESMQSDEDMRRLFREEVKPRLAAIPSVGAYNQEI
ncbi:MAG: hypothetical protein R3C52_03040 [Hyphomonadaceae bacterium]